MRRAAALLGLVVPTLLALSAGAHTRSQSFSSWTLRDGRVDVTVSVAAREVTRLTDAAEDRAGLDAALRTHLRDRLAVRAGGTVCPPASEPRSLAAREGFLRVELRFTCPPETPVEIANDAFFEVAPSHVHYARIRSDAGPLQERLFTDAVRRHEILVAGAAPDATPGTSFATYLALGVEHILIGADHIAFLLALLLLCRRPREVLLLVTGFTVGHSVTLSLAALGWVRPDVAVIEALIGFTIALVAAENVSVESGAGRSVAAIAGAGLLALALLGAFAHAGPPVLTLVGLALFCGCYLPLSPTRAAAARLRPALTVVFGLIHGFGFASVLLEIGLPTGRLAAALFGFNLGVELGQLGIVATLAAVGVVAVRWLPPPRLRLASDLASAALCGLGLYWFVQRAYFA